MDFLPSAEQQALISGIKDLLTRRFPVERLFEVERGIDEQLWRELDEVGIFTLRRAEDDGGLGLGLSDAALVFTELGAACVPGPLVASHLAATHLAGRIDGVPVGAPVTLLDADWTPPLVGHLEASAAVVVLGTNELRLLRSADIVATPVPAAMDPLTPLHELAEVPTGELVGDADAAGRWRREGAVLAAAFQVGLARRLTELAVGYAKQREQFGRVIAGFQAVKHMCADMAVRTELARAAVDAAAVTLDQPEVGDPARAVAGAKLLADEAAGANARAAVQVHGGMGITWEVPVHFFLKRAWLLASEWGTSTEHAEALAELL